MLLARVLVLSVLAQYTRSRVDQADPSSQCLWWLEGTTITWHANDAGNPYTPGDTEVTAVGKAFGTWQAQMDLCGNLDFSQGAATASRKVGYFQDGHDENIVLFRQQGCAALAAASDACWTNDDCGNKFDCWQFGGTALAITTTTYSPASGRIFDADIEFNAATYHFTAVDAPVCVAPSYLPTCVQMDIQNTATHEIGHLLGLSHYASSSSTMNASANPGELTKRVLDPGTRQFVCDAYPQGKPSVTCVTPLLEPTLGAPAGCSAGTGLGGAGLAALGLLGRRRRSARSLRDGATRHRQ